MRKRMMSAATALTLTMTFGAFGATGVALAGEPTTVTETVPVPTTETQTVPQTVPVPGPTQTVTVPGPTKTVTVKVKAPQHKSSGGSNSGTSNRATSHSSPTRNVSIATPSTTATAAAAGTSSDTGTTPVGGVQAGAGGTVDQGPSPALMSLALGMAALGLVSGGVALRRRFGER